MNQEDLLGDIRHTPFLAGLRAPHVELLAQCASQTSFEKGQVIFHQGETANRFYLLANGRVQLEASSETDGRPVLLDFIGPGEVLGWSWLFEPHTWQFTARATEKTDAIFFYGTLLREHCESDPSLGFELLKRMSAVMLKRLQSVRHLLLQAKSGYSQVGGEHGLGSKT